MTNEELLSDLKQLVTAQNSHLEERLGERMDGIEAKVNGIETKMATKEDLRGVEERLNKRIDDVQAAVGDAITQVTDALDITEQVRDLDKRLSRLEHRTA